MDSMASSQTVVEKVVPGSGIQKRHGEKRDTSKFKLFLKWRNGTAGDTPGKSRESVWKKFHLLPNAHATNFHDGNRCEKSGGKSSCSRSVT